MSLWSPLAMRLRGRWIRKRRIGSAWRRANGLGGAGYGIGHEPRRGSAPVTPFRHAPPLRTWAARFSASLSGMGKTTRGYVYSTIRESFFAEGSSGLSERERQAHLLAFHDGDSGKACQRGQHRLEGQDNRMP